MDYKTFIKSFIRDFSLLLFFILIVDTIFSYKPLILSVYNFIKQFMIDYHMDVYCHTAMPCIELFTALYLINYCDKKDYDKIYYIMVVNAFLLILFSGAALLVFKWNSYCFLWDGIAYHTVFVISIFNFIFIAGVFKNQAQKEDLPDLSAPLCFIRYFLWWIILFIEYILLIIIEFLTRFF